MYFSATINGLTRQGHLPPRLPLCPERSKSTILDLDCAQHTELNPARIVPDYNPAPGYEIEEFVWFLSWNDTCNRGTGPNIITAMDTLTQTDTGILALGGILSPGSIGGATLVGAELARWAALPGNLPHVSLPWLGVLIKWGFGSILPR